jgi:hypothetical protein
MLPVCRNVPWKCLEDQLLLPEENLGVEVSCGSACQEIGGGQSLGERVFLREAIVRTVIVVSIASVMSLTMGWV